MRSNELQVELANILQGRTRSEIDQRCRVLRQSFNAGGLSAGLRGNQQPHLESFEAALHMLAMVPRRPNEVDEVCGRLLQDCKFVRPPWFTPELDNLVPTLVAGDPSRPFTAGLAVTVATGKLCPNWGNIEFTEDGRFAWLEITDPGLPSAMKVMFSVNADEIVADMDTQVARRSDVPADQMRRTVYTRQNDIIMGPRFVVSCRSLWWLGLRVDESNPDLANQSEGVGGDA